MAVTLTLASEGLGDSALVVRARGFEAMNRLSHWTVDVVTDQAVDPEALLLAPATLWLLDSDEQSERPVALVITSVEPLGETEGPEGSVFTIELAAEPAPLELVSGYRIFQKKTVPEIVKQLLTDAGITADKQDWRLSGKYPERLHTTQYGETAWGFVERLLGEEGISYWFETKDSGGLCVFGDGPDSTSDIEIDPEVPFEDQSGMVHQRAFSSLEATHTIAHDSVLIRDYDVRNPDLPIKGEAGSGTLIFYEYPAKVQRDAAKARAQARLEQLQRFQRTARGTSDCTRVQAGRKLRTPGARDEGFEGPWLVSEVTHQFARATTTAGEQGSYRNHALLVPADKPHRPAVPAERPLAAGVEPAITTGASGEEIHVNDLGDVKLRFPWDRSGISDDKSSTWIRCVQMGLGGSMVLPRVNWEVTVTHEDGDPDRPIVLGRAYNTQTVVPYALPGGKATTALQSATSPGDGTNNEVRMGDNAGSQEMYVHASKDQSVAVGGSSKVSVTLNELHDVGKSLTVAVGGSQTHSVTSNQTISVTADYMTVVKGARTESIGALEHTKVTANRVCSVKGSYTESVGAAYAIQCNQQNIDVKGLYTQTVGAAAAHTAGLGIDENVAGARVVDIGGAEAMTLRADYTESITGAKRITAGASSVKASGPLTTDVKGKTTVSAASVKINADGPVVITAPKITIDVKGRLKADAFQLSGGTLKVSDGTTSISGTIKRKGGTELE